MRRSWVVLAAIALGLGCGARPQKSAVDYYDDASAHLRKGQYPAAIEAFQEMLDQYPFSDYSEDAELRIGHAQFLDRRCPEAIASFTDFQRRYPTSPHLAFIGYLIGRCYEREMRPPNRDQSAALNAHAHYATVTRQYPASPYADLARQHLDRCRENLAKHELIVARFYAKRDNPKAAEYRLLDLVNHYPETEIAAEALVRLGDLYRDGEDPELARLAYAAAQHHHPDHPQATRAGRRLADLGADPVPGDPLVVLRAQAGRTRSLAIAQIEPAPWGP